MNCREVQAYLDDLLLAEPKQEADADVVAHAATCEQCRHAYDMATRTLALLQLSGTVEISTELKERIMSKIEIAEVVTSRLPQASEGTRRVWKRSLVAAAAIMMVVAGLAMLARPGKPVYALEKAIEATQSLRTVHQRIAPPAPGTAGEIWARFDEKGELVTVRMNFPETDDGPKDVIFEDGKARVWFKRKGSCLVVKDPGTLEGLKREYSHSDPRQILKDIRATQGKDGVSVQVHESASADEPTTLTVTRGQSPGNKEVYKVDPKTNLLSSVEMYETKDGVVGLTKTTEYIEHNQPFADNVFTFDLPQGYDSDRPDRADGWLGTGQSHQGRGGGGGRAGVPDRADQQGLR